MARATGKVSSLFPQERCTMRRQKRSTQIGFSLLELLLVVVVLLIVTGFAVPSVLNAIYGSRLKGAASDFASLLQVARIRAVQDDRFYSVYVLAQSGTSPEQGYVDIYPQSSTGA